MSMMKLLTSAVLACGLGLGAAGAQELKFANYMAPTHPYVAGAFDPLAAKIAEATGGAVTVKVYNGGELGAGPADQYSRVVDGVAELAVGLPGYTAANFPLTLLTELPGVLTEADGTATLWKNIDLLGPEYERVKLVSLWSNAQNILYTRDKPVRTPDDVKGMKIRVPSRNAGLIVEAWGGSPVSMPVSEIYNAMQTGVIDAAMIDGTATMAFKLGEVANYLTVGMDTAISPFFILMNRDAFDGLSAEHQAAVDAVGREVSVLGNQVQLSEAAKGIEKFGATEGKELIKLTPEEAAAFNTLSAPVVDTVVAETGGDAQAIIDALRAK
ncbi:C4-dicarboxylate ABC transporter substrate-binding protein [Gemmobacter aquaticus]|uniref:C4-dicarboxylate ABC transporter substrate-binding protein n=1 Tax=Gemmobacter aquaticus TaxID=490185 RepID=A0A917YN33_9RHOB|nr:TRAP transporter substrate-binding protein [Gemmobacter aquaticus]GGO38419.1 C4-dicarboxylate ABC transporter substrate-binding protein [Gemmobacter aquaticus]